MDKRSEHQLATRDQVQAFMGGVRCFLSFGGIFRSLVNRGNPRYTCSLVSPFELLLWKERHRPSARLFLFSLSPPVAIEAAQKNTNRTFQSSSRIVNCLESNFNVFLGVILIWKTSGGFEHVSSLLGSGLSQREDENLQDLLLLAAGSSSVSYCQCLVFSLQITLRTHRYFWQSSVCSELFIWRCVPTILLNSNVPSLYITLHFNEQTWSLLWFSNQPHQRHEIIIVEPIIHVESWGH